MEKVKIRYKDLSAPLQASVIVSYIIGTLYAVFFLMGIFAVVMRVE